MERDRRGCRPVFDTSHIKLRTNYVLELELRYIQAPHSLWGHTSELTQCEEGVWYLTRRKWNSLMLMRKRQGSWNENIRLLRSSCDRRGQGEIRVEATTRVGDMHLHNR